MKAGDDLHHWGDALGIGYDINDRISTSGPLAVSRPSLKKTQKQPECHTGEYHAAGVEHRYAVLDVA